MATALLQRLAAAETLLVASIGGDDYAAISLGQSEVLLALMSATRCGCDELGPIAEKIVQCPWASEGEKAGLLRSLGQMTGPSRNRAQMQNYENLASFISAPQWRLLLDSELDYHSKACLLCDHAVSLGLRHPSEPTVARMVGLLMVCVEGADKARCMSGQNLRDVFLDLKSMLKTRCKVAPMEVILTLGSDVATFAAGSPRTFAAAFASGPPVLPEVRIAEVAVVSQGISMRSRKRGERSVTSSSPIVGMDPLQAMVQQAVAQSLQNVFGSMGSSSSSHVPLQMLGRRPMGALQQPLQQCQPQQLALLPPMPPAEHAIAAGEAAAAVTPPREAAQEAAAAPPAEEDAPPRRKGRRTVDEATVAILEAMGKKSAVVKRPAAAVPAAAVDEDAEIVLDEGIDVGKPPRYGVEATRSQVMFRTGLQGKGQTKALKFHNEASKKKAIAEAEVLVAAERRRRGL